MEPLSPAEIARMRAEHVPTTDTGECNECLHGHFPCDAAKLLAELDRREANPPQWQGRNHQSPVPHLAGITAGLFDPSASEEFHHA